MLASQKFRGRNPNPITKILATILLGFTILHTINDLSMWIIVTFISIMFFVNGFKIQGIKGFLVFILLYNMPNFSQINSLPAIVKMFVGLIIVVKMFYLPFLAGAYLIKTSDVGSIISSMDKLRISMNVSIPIAVMFRFFPSFKEEKKNIKLAMKIRGITLKNPLSYLEYISVPILILSSNIADDIAKAAETKCIGNPVAKTRYREVSIKPIDFIYLGVIGFAVIGGWIW